jgi:excisionase family DNA binding protein
MTVTTTPKEGLMTPREVSKFLRVKPRTVAKWCREGRLRAIKVGHVWRIRTFDGKPIIEVREEQ